MRKTTILAGLVAGVLATSAPASVIYDWQPVSGGEYTSAVSGQIVFNDAAYRSGHALVDTDDPALDDRTPIISASLSFDPNGTAATRLHPAGVGVPGVEIYTPSTSLSADLAFEDNGYLNGSLSILGVLDHFTSTSDNGLWTISDVNSDYFSHSGHCTGNYEQPCSGGTGYWVRANAVPEPPVGWLFGLAMLALAGIRRMTR